MKQKINPHILKLIEGEKEKLIGSHFEKEDSLYFFDAFILVNFNSLVLSKNIVNKIKKSKTKTIVGNKYSVDLLLGYVEIKPITYSYLLHYNKIDLPELFYNIKTVRTLTELERINQMVSSTEIGEGVWEKINKDFARINSGKLTVVYYQTTSKEIVSTARCYIKANNAQIAGVVTKPSHRGQGIAKDCTIKLLKMFEKTPIYIFVANAVAKEMYNRLGFEDITIWAKTEKI